MSYTHSFENVIPFARYDDVPWTVVRVEESPTATGPWTEIQVISLPVDVTPDQPNAVNFTVTDATIPSGYFRFRFDVTIPNPSPYTDEVLSPSVGGAGVYYTTVTAVKAWLSLAGDTVLSDEYLTRAIIAAQRDIDTAAGGWIAYDDTGLKFASAVETYDVLTTRESEALSNATCAQVEYRLLMGDDFMVKDQYDSESGPDSTVVGSVRKVSGVAYSLMQQAGLLRLWGRARQKRINSFGNFGRLRDQRFIGEPY